MICHLELIVGNHAQVRHNRGERYRVQLQVDLIDADLCMTSKYDNIPWKILFFEEEAKMADAICLSIILYRVTMHATIVPFS